MLKELWRKLGSEFLQTDESAEGAGRAQGRAAGRRSGAKMLPHITHTGEFHLERLNQLLRDRYDHAFVAPENPTANDETLKEVISYASRIQDQDIQRELLLFYLNCSPVIQEYLRSETTLGTGSFLGK